MIGVHVHGQPSQSRQLLQLTLQSRSTAEVLQLTYDAEHRGQCHLTDPKTETLVGAEAKVCVLVQIAVQADLLRIRPGLGIVAGRYLNVEERRELISGQS